MMYKNATVPKIDVSEGTDVNKTTASKEWPLPLLVFWRCGFKLEKHICNGCHDLLTRAYCLKNIAIMSAKENTFKYILIQ